MTASPIRGGERRLPTPSDLLIEGYKEKLRCGPMFETNNDRPEMSEETLLEDIPDFLSFEDEFAYQERIVESFPRNETWRIAREFIGRHAPIK